MLGRPLRAAPFGRYRPSVRRMGLSAPSDYYSLPTERATLWQPGVTYNGGIPTRSTIYTTINASTYGNGASDARAGIQSALDACPSGQVVLLSAGTFKIASGQLEINKDITLRGAGPTSTTITSGSVTGQPVVILGRRWPSIEASTNLTADAAKGSYSVTVASATGLFAGQLVLIDKLHDTSISQYANDCGTSCQGWFSRTGRPISQMMVIDSVVSNTVTFTTPFHITFDTAYTAQLTRYSVAAVKDAGIEDLKLYGGQGGDGGGNLYMQFAANSWAKNIESEYSNGSSVHIYNCFRCELRDSYIHTAADPNPGGGGYGIDISTASSDCLVENNISWKFNKVMVMRASGGGNVVAYNYMEDGYIDYQKAWMETGINASHMTCPHYVLFEGNQSFNMGSDARWGNSVYITFFRNHSTGIRRDISSLGLTDQGNRTLADVKAFHHYYTFVGNVLGFSGMTPGPQGSSFTYEDQVPYANDPVPMWKFGEGETVGTGGVNDTVARSTALRDGNFDYVTNAVAWDSASRPLPDSLYAPSKPAFFSSNTWPWVDAAGATKTHTLPARARFDAIHGL